MQHEVRGRLTALLMAVAMATQVEGCGNGGSSECASTLSPDVDCGDVGRYFGDSSYRREELVASLVNPDNGYSALRLGHYATGTSGDWEALPEWNPPVAPVVAGDLGNPLPRAVGDAASPLTISLDARRGSIAALLRLGEAAFRLYPVQLLDTAAYALSSEATAESYGFHVDATGDVGGLVWAEMADGSSRLAMTCSTCHSRTTGGGSTPGLPNVDLDLGRLMVDASGVASDPKLAWGPGRLDVTTEAGLEPVRIPDLRPLADLEYLQADGSVRARNLVDVAIRLETLVITAQNDVLRPPREVAMGLAVYLASLSQTLPSPATTASRGRNVFVETCASCHEPPRYSGAIVPLGEIGTDPTVGDSAERGTGGYRVPSLRGVGTRGPLLHDGTVPNVGALFDPHRLDPDYSGRLHGAGPIAGHEFGLALPPADRRALVLFLETL